VTMQVLHHSFGMLEQIRAFLTVVEEGSLLLTDHLVQGH
jgi:hypothetical protein